MPEIPEGYSVLEGSERQRVAGAKHLGPADDDASLRVSVLVRRRTGSHPMPDSECFLQTPPSKRRRLPQDEFETKYGASAEDIAKVVSFAEAHGLTVRETHLARRTVGLSGSVAAIGQAFGVQLSRYERHIHEDGKEPLKETWRGHEGAVHIPAELTGIVQGVFGLDNRLVAKRNASGASPAALGYTAGDLAKLYNFPANPATGQTIGIVSTGGYLASDIAAAFDGHPPAIAEISVDAGNDGKPDPETTQDICIAAAAAPGAAIAVYLQPGSQLGWIEVFSRIVHPLAGDPHCSVVSCSLYICNGDDASTLAHDGLTSAFISVMSSIFHDAAVQGITICVASGDTGTNSKVNDGKAHVQFPATSPWVLAVGGTTIADSRESSFEEQVWNDHAPGNPSLTCATGGGVSDFFNSLPSWQQGAGVPGSLNDGHVGRGVPDVAASANPNAGYRGIVVGGLPFTGGGTSASAPLWAALIAAINAALGENLGFVNPVLYALGAKYFRNIAAGAGPADNSNGGVPGYPAVPGWNACTGWGSPNGVALLEGMRQHFAAHSA